MIACGAFLFLGDLDNNVDSIQQYFDMAPREIRVCFLLVFLASIVLTVAVIVVASKAKNNEKNDHIRKL